jgi:two-component system sensor histidine kinase AlgZ
MNIYPLVFSNNLKYRITRHVLFWVLWISYYTIFMTISWLQKYPFSTSFSASLVEETLAMPLDILFCYAVIYFLIPRFLFTGRYILMVVLWLAFSLIHITCYRFYSANIIPLIRSAYHLPYSVHTENFLWTFFYIFTQITMEASLAVAIKLGKMWYIKQQELNIIKSEKQKIEPNENGKIQPVFLINALDKVESLALRNPSAVGGAIKKIKDLLLYVIYDSNQPKIALDKELRLLEEFVELEKVGNNIVNVNLKIIGNIKDEKIAPFIILPLTENCFRQLSMLEVKQKFMNLEARIVDGIFTLDISWSKPVDTSTLTGNDSTFLQNIGKRLKLLYPESHELKIQINTDQFAIKLKIDLHRASIN